jgi:hypothetical protein
VSLRATPLLVCAFAAHAAFAQPARPQPPAPTSMPCVEVRIGQDSAGRLDCLNRAFRAEVDKVAPTVAADAVPGMPPSQLGQPTPAALKQRLGNAWGHSLVPQRPPRTFAPPLPPAR